MAKTAAWVNPGPSRACDDLPPIGTAQAASPEIPTEKESPRKISQLSSETGSLVPMRSKDGQVVFAALVGRRGSTRFQLLRVQLEQGKWPGRCRLPLISCPTLRTGESKIIGEVHYKIIRHEFEMDFPCNAVVCWLVKRTGTSWQVDGTSKQVDIPAKVKILIAPKSA